MKINEVRLSGRAIKDAARIGKGPYRMSLACGGTEVFDACCWHEHAATVRRGDEVLVVGRLRQSRWEKDGQQHTRIEIVANEVTVPAAEPAPAPLTPQYKYPIPERPPRAQKVAEARPVTLADPIGADDIPF